MAGLEFFRLATRLARRLAPGQTVRWSLQTNGLLLDDEWCRFLAEERFLVGWSLDGPARLHDAYRRDRQGRGSHKVVVGALRPMQQHGVEVNVLVAVHAENTAYPLEVYHHLRGLGARHLQFIPVVEREASGPEQALGLRLGAPESAGRRRTPWSVPPEAYGEFLVRVFDE